MLTLYIPFLWFFILSCYSYKNRGLDTYTFVSVLYAISSLCSIFFYFSKDMEPQKTNISIVPSLVYCLLLTLIMLPLKYFSPVKIKKIVIRNTKLFDAMTVFFFCGTIYTLIANWEDILFRLAYGDWEDLRTIVMNGDLIVAKKYGLSKYLGLLFSYPGSISYIMFPIFFIYAIFLKKPWWMSTMAFLGTTNLIFTGIMQVDRSSTFRWLLVLLFNYIFFRQFITRRIKKKLYPIMALMISFALLYLGIVTLGRFGQDNYSNSILSYSGKPYINFCYLWDNFDNREGVSTKFLLPATHFYIIRDYEGNVARQKELTEKTGIECGMFYSVLGSFILDANRVGPFLFTFLYLLLFSFFNKGSSISDKTYFSIYLLSIIPLFGFIAYNYTSPTSTLSIIAFILVLSMVRAKNSFIVKL